MGTRQEWSEQTMMVVAAAEALRARFRAATYQTLISLLAASGLRIGEALSLDRGDLDADQGMLTVRDAKFGKTRLVPLHSSATAALKGPLLRHQLSDAGVLGSSLRGGYLGEPAFGPAPSGHLAGVQLVPKVRGMAGSTSKKNGAAPMRLAV